MKRTFSIFAVIKSNTFGRLWDAYTERYQYETDAETDREAIEEYCGMKVVSERKNVFGMANDGRKIFKMEGGGEYILSIYKD